MARKLFTRNEYEQHLIAQAKRMSADKDLAQRALDLFERASNYDWIPQTKWFGEPALNPAQDMFARQEIIFQTKPDYIIELGVAWGGTLLFYSTIMEAIGGKKIIGIDIFMPPDLVKRLKNHKKLAKRITLIEGGSTTKETLDKVRKIIGRNKKLLVICDSNHTHAHVLDELRTYSPLVGKGYYMICDDTHVEDFSKSAKVNTDRPWGPGNNPRTALRQFFKENKRFITDDVLQNKLLISCNPDGYLKCIKN